MKKAYIIYEIPSKEPICELLELQREERGRRQQKLIYRKTQNVPNLGSELIKLIGQKTKTI